MAEMCVCVCVLKQVEVETQTRDVRLFSKLTHSFTWVGSIRFSCWCSLTFRVVGYVGNMCQIVCISFPAALVHSLQLCCLHRCLHLRLHTYQTPRLLLSLPCVTTFFECMCAVRSVEYACVSARAWTVAGSKRG
jgi:hypothetical protein